MKKVLDAILPPRCIVTGDIVDVQGMMSPKAWAMLNFITPPMCVACGRPFEFDMDNAQNCPSCLSYPPSFNRARAALAYDDQSRDMILKYKHADHLHFTRAFLPWLKNAGREMLAEADCLIPVPLHRWRLLSRRYNQAAVIAQALAQDLKIEHFSQALMRTRSTVSQGHLNAKERYKNVRKAFAVHPRYKGQIIDKNIVLIDDVYTTGATINECTKVLRKAGARQVDILTLARVVRSEHII